MRHISPILVALGLPIMIQGCAAKVPGPPAPPAPSPALTPTLAKEALLDLIRTNPDVFVGKPDPEKLADIHLKEQGDGRYSLGAFELNIPDTAYSATVGIDPPSGAHGYIYNGSFERKDGKWVASTPKVMHVWPAR